MKIGLADRQNAVMASAAVTEHLRVIDLRRNGPAQGGMAGLTHVSGRHVSRGFTRNGDKVVVVAVLAA